MYTSKFKITNITCAACVRLSVETLQGISGVVKAMVDMTTGQVELAAERELTRSEIVETLHGIGKEAVFIS